jgi:hypothetical protein
MVHKFSRSDKDPYSESVRALSENLPSSPQGTSADAESQIYDELGAVIVSALGDIAAAAYRLGVTQTEQRQGLASAVSRAAGAVFSCYQGEVSADSVFKSIEDDPRLTSFPAESKQKILREIDRSRQLEQLLLEARRFPALLDHLGSMGLHVDDTALDRGTVLLTQHPTPTAGTT